MVIEGLPLFFLEMGIGQKFRRCALLSWKEIHPVFFGVGVGMLMVSIMLCLYYVVVIAWCCYYFFISFTSQLPWQKHLLCKNAAAYTNLYQEMEQFCSGQNATCKNTTTYLAYQRNYTNFPDCCVRDPPQYYFYHHTLQISPSIDDIGVGINGKLAGCLLFAWVITYLCIVKGIKSSGKVHVHDRYTSIRTDIFYKLFYGSSLLFLLKEK